MDTCGYVLNKLASTGLGLATMVGLCCGVDIKNDTPSEIAKSNEQITMKLLGFIVSPFTS